MILPLGEVGVVWYPCSFTVRLRLSERQMSVRSHGGASLVNLVASDELPSSLWHGVLLPALNWVGCLSPRTHSFLQDQILCSDMVLAVDPKLLVPCCLIMSSFQQLLCALGPGCMSTFSSFDDIYSFTFGSGSSRRSHNLNRRDAHRKHQRLDLPRHVLSLPKCIQISFSVLFSVHSTALYFLHVNIPENAFRCRIKKRIWSKWIMISASEEKIKFRSPIWQLRVKMIPKR